MSKKNLLLAALFGILLLCMLCMATVALPTIAEDAGNVISKARSNAADSLEDLSDAVDVSTDDEEVEEPSRSPASTTAEPSRRNETDEQAEDQLCVGRGTYAGSPIEIGVYQNGATYFIPGEVLIDVADGNALLFEGEQQKEGTHDVMVVVLPDGTFGDAVGEDGLDVRDEGSFWRLEATMAPVCPDGYRPVDDELMKLARDKRQNWLSQGMRGNPIRVWLTEMVVIYQPEDEIPLTAEQESYANQAANERCSFSVPYEETPRGDTIGVASLGSSDCTTVVIYRNRAVWFEGARDGVPYETGTDRVFIIPATWSIDELEDWVHENFDIEVSPYDG